MVFIMPTGMKDRPMRAELNGHRLKLRHLKTVMAVAEWGELAAVPSRKVPMSAELQTEILFHEPTACVRMKNWPSGVG
jgi:hypothetical protein